MTQMIEVRLFHSEALDCHLAATTADPNRFLTVSPTYEGSERWRVIPLTPERVPGDCTPRRVAESERMYNALLEYFGQDVKVVAHERPPRRPVRLSETYDVFGMQVCAEISGWPNETLEAAKRYVTGLKAERDGEDGPEFWSWIVEHLVANLLAERPRARRDADPNTGACETFFLARREGGEVLGTISTVRDDRGRGARYGLDGLWLGGFNVAAALRGGHLGSHLFDKALGDLYVLAVGHRRPVKVNLFTRNGLVKALAARRGFVRHGLALPGELPGTEHYYRVIEKANYE
jgi:hypothetical protein